MNFEEAETLNAAVCERQQWQLEQNIQFHFD